MTSTDANEYIFPYAPQRRLSILMMLFFFAITWLLIDMAMTFDRGLEIRFIPGVDGIVFSQRTAIWVLWSFVVVSMLMFVVFLYAIIASFTSTKEVRITDKGISCPPSWIFSHETVFVPYDAISELVVMEFGSRPILFIEHEGGSTRIAQMMLSSKDTFTQIIDLIEARMS